MSSTNKTPNLNMHSWVRTDPVVCSDFNENFNKIDTAIGQMRASYGCCEIYTGEFTGTGSTSMSLTFPKVPLYIVFGQYEWCFVYYCFIGEGRRVQVHNDVYAIMSINGNTVTWTRVSESGAVFNEMNKHYRYVAFTSATL